MAPEAVAHTDSAPSRFHPGELQLQVRAGAKQQALQLPQQALPRPVVLPEVKKRGRGRIACTRVQERLGTRELVIRSGFERGLTKTIRGDHVTCVWDHQCGAVAHTGGQVSVPWAAHPALPPKRRRRLLAAQPLFYVAFADADARVWASVLMGPPGFINVSDARTVTISPLRIVHGGERSLLLKCPPPRGRPQPPQLQAPHVPTCMPRRPAGRQPGGRQAAGRRRARGAHAPPVPRQHQGGRLPAPRRPHRRAGQPGAGRRPELRGLPKGAATERPLAAGAQTHACAGPQPTVLPFPPSSPRPSVCRSTSSHGRSSSIGTGGSRWAPPRRTPPWSKARSAWAPRSVRWSGAATPCSSHRALRAPCQRAPLTTRSATTCRTAEGPRALCTWRRTTAQALCSSGPTTVSGGGAAPGV